MADIALGLALNQTIAVLRPGGPTSINDCWVISGIQAACAVGGVYLGPGSVALFGWHVPTIPVFRAAAGKPDAPGLLGAGSVDDVIAGAIKLYPKLRITKSSKAWATFRVALITQGKVASVTVDSSLLPTERQYGFGKKGVRKLHQITVRWNGAEFYMINPLQPAGSKATPITEAQLKRAALYDGLHVFAALFAPEPPPPVVPPVQGGGNVPVDPNIAIIANLKKDLAAAQALAVHTKAEFDAYVLAEQKSDKAIREAIILEADKLLL